MQEFQSFYQENLGPIYRFVYSNVRNQQEAEDLTSQVFLKALRSLDLERSMQSGQKWLFQVARTTIADYWRVHYRGATSSLDDLLEAGWEGPAAEQELSLANSGAEDRVQAILQALPARYREVLICRFLMNLTIREAALKMGITEANAKIVQFRALKYAANLGDVAREVTKC
ncbi:MAG: sigma-70 family RNA polymerase sigma factor [Chloroflexi bacterium]|nr:MAG: sigma-70 family RNA polymerase sigma factor [Chloroflexota bacterium]